MQGLSESERNAVRAYLGRAEVRLSTLHRIATAYISGAGLLLLIPIFLRDIVEALLQKYLALPVYLPFEQWELNTVVFVFLLYPFILSLAIPLYGVFLLLKDIMHFYFTLYAPGFPESLLNPALSINALTFSPDESAQVRQTVYEMQYQTRTMNYMLPFSEKRRERYFDSLYEYTHGDIVPPSRAHIASDGLSERDIMRMNTAFGIARALDRTLTEEVALMEMTITRNILYLRRLILRYVKTLLMFIWTAVVSFATLPFLEQYPQNQIVVLVLVYLVWSVIALSLIHMPIVWIYRHRDGQINKDHIDIQLNLMERRIKPFLYASILSACLIIAMILVQMGMQ